MKIQLLPYGLKIGVERSRVPPLQRRKALQLSEGMDALHHGRPGTENENAVREADGLGDVVGYQEGGFSLLTDDAADVTVRRV